MASVDCVTNVRWPVSDLMKRAFNSYQFLASKEFAVMGSDVNFRLEFELKDIRGSPDGSSYLFLSVRDFNDEESVRVRFKIWMETSKGNKLTTSNQELEEDMSLKDGSDRLYYDIKNSDISFFFDNYSRDTVLVVCCELRLADPGSRLNDSYSSAIEFRKNLWLAHTDGLRGYCTIEAEGQKFHVAKDLLMSQSKVFDRMFSSSSGSIESKESFVKIKDTRADVIKVLISYLYLGKPQKFEPIASELFVFADKYAFEKLKGQCLQYLIHSMSKQNIFARLIYAFFYNNPVLKSRALEFIKVASINVDEIIETTAWNGLIESNSALADEIKKEILI